MIKQNKLVPKRRFEEFEKEWRKSKFLEIVFRLSEKSKEDIPRVEFEDINSGLGTLNKDIYKKKSEKIGVKFNSGDILFGKLRPYLKNWLLADFDGIAVGDFWVLRPNDNNSELIYALIQGEKYQQIANLSTGTKMPRSDWEIVSNTKFALPASNKEQQKIGQFFKHLDDMIALQQRKLDKTKALKSAYLAEMFPTEGECVPKRRFEGFSEEWKKFKFENVTDMFNNLRIPVTASKRIPGDTPYYGANGIQDYVKGSTHNGEFVLVAEDGANDLNNYPVQYVNGKLWVNNHAHVIAGKNNIIDNSFLVSRMKSMNISKWLVGGGRAKLNAESLKVIQIRIPIFEEQQKIGQFFKHLDEMIATHQQKLKKLKATKQAYLHEMFV